MPADEDRRRGLSRALYEEIRARITDGTYAAGVPLPSTRSLAAERGMSRGTVSLVYEQLAADGFIESRAGAASRVSAGAKKNGPDGQCHARARVQGATMSCHAGRLSVVDRRIAAMGIRFGMPVRPLPPRSTSSLLDAGIGGKGARRLLRFGGPVDSRPSQDRLPAAPFVLQEAVVSVDQDREQSIRSRC